MGELTLVAAVGSRENPVLKKILHVPFGGTLGLPCPEDPAVGLFVGLGLSFNAAKAKSAKP